MPQIVIKSKNNPKARRYILRTLIDYIFKIIWPLIPRSIYLGNILHINVALTRVCNANCIFCAYQFIENENKTSMSDEIFNLVIENIRRFSIPAVMLSPDVGEPLLAKDFMGKIKTLRKVGVRSIECTTNGIVLNHIGIDNMLEDGPDQINISTAGFNEDMYKRIYRSDKYNWMRDNVIELLKANSLRKKKKIINVWLRGDVDIKELLCAPEMNVVMELANDVCVMNEVDPWNGKIRQGMLTGNLKIQTSFPKVNYRPCRQLIEIAIHPNGDVHACSCRNMGEDPDLHLGNITEDNIYDIYQRLNRIFYAWEKKKFPKICHRCFMYIDPATSILGRIRQLITELI